MSSENISFFGAVDRKNQDSNGPVGSSYPAWYLEQHIEHMKEDIDSRKRWLERGAVPPASHPAYVAEIRRLEERYNLIKESKPKLNIGERNKLKKVLSDLESEIKSSNFTYDEMHFGADPRREMNLNKKPSIKIDQWLAEAANVKIDKNGLASRDAATRALAIGSRLMGDERRVEEKIREKKMTCRTQKFDSFAGAAQVDKGVMDGREATTEVSA